MNSPPSSAATFSYELLTKPNLTRSFWHLPKDHEFLKRRVTIDWSFKFISWISLTAALQVFATLTASWFVWALWIVAQTLLLWFMNGFFDYFFDSRRNTKVGSGSLQRSRLGWRIFAWSLYVLTFFAAYVSVSEAVRTMAEYQIKKR